MPRRTSRGPSGTASTINVLLRCSPFPTPFYRHIYSSLVRLPCLPDRRVLSFQNIYRTKFFNNLIPVPKSVPKRFSLGFLICWVSDVDPYWFQCGSGSREQISADPDPGQTLPSLKAEIFLEKYIVPYL